MLSIRRGAIVPAAGSDMPWKIPITKVWSPGSAISRYFKVPPKEFVFLNRKLIGVYTFIAVLNAEFNGEHLLKQYLYGDPGAPDALSTSQITKP